MTFRIGRNQIHIGLPETLAIISAIIGFAWGARAYYDVFLQDKQETNRRLAVIERQLSIKNDIDSTQTAEQNKLAAGQKAMLMKFDSIGNNLLSHRTTKRIVTSSGIKLYTERWVNGQLMFTEVKPY